MSAVFVFCTALSVVGDKASGGGETALAAARSAIAGGDKDGDGALSEAESVQQMQTSSVFSEVRTAYFLSALAAPFAAPSALNPRPCSCPLVAQAIFKALKLEGDRVTIPMLEKAETGESANAAGLGQSEDKERAQQAAQCITHERHEVGRSDRSTHLSRSDPVGAAQRHPRLRHDKHAAGTPRTRCISM